MTEEIWKAIPGHPGYEASSEGRIRSIDRVVYASGRSPERRRKGVVLKPALKSRGYLNVSLGRGPGNTFRVYRLVCLAFHGEPPEGKGFVCHRDDNPGNNTPDNLYWGSHQDNMDDKARNGHARNQYFYATHCKRGHVRTEENTYYRPSQPTVRACKPCMVERNRKAAKASRERKMGDANTE